MKNNIAKRYTEIMQAISDYALAYSTFEKYQKSKEQIKILPEHGDQKTGVIGEFYSYLFLVHQKKNQLEIAPHGYPYDLSYHENGNPVKIQVKTVLTGYSKTNSMSPIKDGWDYIYLVSLNTDFMPDGFWINKYQNTMFKGRKIIQSARMKKPGSDKSEGSKIFDFSNNRAGELNRIINKYLKQI